MLIDPIVPRILQARGLSRREAAAALRVHHLSHRFETTEEADFVIRHALACETYDEGEYTGTRYDIPICKGVRLVERSGGGRFAPKGVHAMTGTVVVVDKVVPTTVTNTLVGRPLRDVVDHPLLPGDATIRDVQVTETTTEIGIPSNSEELAVVMPATQNDLELTMAAWVRMRRVQVLAAEANHGMSPRVRDHVLRRAVLPTSLTVSIPLAAWFAAGGNPLLRLAAAVGFVLLALFTALRYRSDVRRAVEAEDSALLPRLRDMRDRMIAERRTAILEGRDVPAKAA